MSLATILLAAGRSTRFGAEDKLEARIDGKPMLTRSAEIAAASGADRLIVVLRREDQTRLLPSGVERVICTGAMADSLQAGLRALGSEMPSKTLIMLADMPFVQPSHIHQIIAACGELPACASLRGQPLPPACFPASWMPDLFALTGDHGANALLRNLPVQQHIYASEESLHDIDRPGDMRQRYNLQS